MGCVQSLNTDASNFSQDERKILHKTWLLLSTNLTETGIQVFMKVTLDPEIKTLFQWQYMSETEMYQSELFRGHAAKFMMAIGAVMENLENLDGRLFDLLAVLGRKHRTVPGFDSMYFEKFVDATNMVWQEKLGSRYTEKAQRTWTKLFMYIKARMTYGMEQTTPINLPSIAIAEAETMDLPSERGTTNGNDPAPTDTASNIDSNGRQ